MLELCYPSQIFLKVHNIDLLQIIVIVTIKLVLTWIVEESNDKAILAEGSGLAVAARDLSRC